MTKKRVNEADFELAKNPPPAQISPSKNKKASKNGDEEK